MRTVTGMVLAIVVGLVAGCNPEPASQQKAKTEPTTPTADPPRNPTPPPNPPAAGTPPSSAPATTPAGKADPPAQPVTGWELDPARHVIPNTPVAGRVGGEVFAPDVQVQANTLRFRVLGPQGVPTREISLIFFLEAGKTLEGRKVVIRPDQPSGPESPGVVVTEQGKPPAPVLDKGYALTLELGKREKGKLPGKIALSLPGPEKTFLAGTFAAEWVRERDEPPSPDDAPFIAGTVMVTGGPAGPEVRVGYVRVEPFDPAVPPLLAMLGIPFKPGDAAARWDVNRPQVLVLVPPGTNGQPSGRYELLHLEPGRYWVFAAVPGGPGAWTWVTVAANGQATGNLAIDTSPTASGSLHVSVPAGAGEVSVVPAAEPGKPWPAQLAVVAASMLDLQAKGPNPAKESQATFPRLRPGKYEVHAGGLTGTVEVKASETAKLELKKK